MIYKLYLKTDKETLDKLNLYCGEYCGFTKSAKYIDKDNKEVYLSANFFPMREDFLGFSGVMNHSFKEKVIVLNDLDKIKI